MNVVHVVVSDAFAGVEAHVSRLARAQAAAGHPTVVVGGDPVRTRDAAGPDVTVLPGATIRSAAASLEAVAGPVDVVHAHMTAAELVAAATVVLRRRSSPVVSTRHFAQRRGLSVAGRLAAPYVARRVAAQIAISQYTAARVDGVSTVVLAGVERRPDRVRGAAGSGVVLMAQRLEPEKRADLGLRAFAASGVAAEGWRLRVAGDGSERDHLQHLVDELGLHGSVELLGHRSDVHRLMAEADLFLAPTPGEHFGLSVLEAMANGLPVVADASGGHLETLGDAGASGLYRSQDTGAAAAVLRDMASHTGARRSLGAALQARQRSHFSLERQVLETDAVYRSVL